MTTEQFLAYIKYKPMHVGNDLGDGVRFISFRSRKGFSTNLEFGTECTSKGQYLYWEIVDWNDYKQGDIISVDSDRRHDVLNTMLTDNNADYIAAFINNSLERHYKH